MELPDAAPKFKPLHCPSKGNSIEEHLSHKIKCHDCLSSSLSPVFARSQTADQQSGSTQDPQTQQPGSAGSSAPQPDAPAVSNPVPQVSAPDAQKTDFAEGKQTSRMFWVVPNFAAVSADTKLPPLSAHEKFMLAKRDSVDYSSFVWAGLLAARSMALKSDPEPHQGLKGYSRYYWRAFVDQASGAYLQKQ